MQVKRLYQLIFDLHQIFVNSSIKYWITDDLLLSTVLCNGLISIDQNIRFCILKKDVKKILNLKNLFKTCGYQLQKIRGGYTVSRKSGEYCEIFVFTKENNNIVNKILKESFFEHSIIKYDFGNHRICVPNNFEIILDKKYGDIWNYDAKRLKPFDTIIRSCIHGSMCLRPTKIINPYKYITKLKSRKKRIDTDCMNNFDKNVGVYVINCDMHKERLEKFKHYANEADLKFCRESCVKGKELTYNLFCEMKKKKLLKKNADMNAIEIAINMSHYNCWTRMLNNNEDYALILEDDCEVHKDFVYRVNNLLNELQKKNIDFSILFLWSGNWMNTISKQKYICTIDNMKIMQEKISYNNGCVAYIISKKFAEILQNYMYPIKFPQDILLGDLYKKGRHLTIKMKKENGCYISPLLNNPCGGEGGTGNTTQDYASPSIKNIICRKCK